MRVLFILIIVCFFCVTNAFCLSLDDAKSRGLVGETTSGYLGAVTVSSEVSSLVASVNAKRRKKYEQIARKNGISMDQVEKLAAKKAIQKTPPGQFVQNQNGKWIKK